MPPAARVGDPTVGTTPEHPTGLILPPAASTVAATGQARARVNDKVQCACGSNDYIVTGSPAVLVGGLPAARVGSLTMHGTTVAKGDLTVDVGGPSVGATLGSPERWLAPFDGLRAGRRSGSPRHTYANGGVESSRALILANSGGVVGEDQAVASAPSNYRAGSRPGPARGGSTTAADREHLLRQYGVASHLEPQEPFRIQQAVADGKGVITSHDAGLLWGNRAYQGAGHAVTVTGVEYDGQGAPQTVYTNDTGLGRGAHPVPAADFFASLAPGADMNVSDGPLAPGRLAPEHP